MRRAGNLVGRGWGLGLGCGGVVAVEMVAPGAAGDVAAIGRLADLVNRVYAVAEDGLWADGWTRTSAPDIARLVAAGEIAVARHGDHDQDVVGIVRVRHLDHEVGEFGMLAADPAVRGKGIGRDLVDFAEDRCRRHGRTVMQLELLVPRARVHPGKASLDAWYSRLGYRPVHVGAVADTHPQLAPLLATPCDVVTYRKPLTPPT